MTSRPDPEPPLIPAALAGDAPALAMLLDASGVAAPSTWLLRHRLAPAVASAAMRAGLELPPAWRQLVTTETVSGLMLERALKQAGGALDDAAIPWIPLKGMDLRYRLYDDPLQRPTSDVDLLVRAADFERARSALEAVGFHSAIDDERVRQYERAEGYNWQAFDDAGVLLELHFRLWSIVPEQLATDVFERALAAPHLGAVARLLSWPDAMLLATVHAWLDPNVRSALSAREVYLLATRLSNHALPLAPLINVTLTNGLQLPVAVGLRGADEFFPDSTIAAATRTLIRNCTPLERIAFTLEGVLDQRRSFRLGYLARILSGRPTRRSWQVLWRQLRPHAAQRRRG